MMSANKDFHYEIDKDFDFTIDEKNNSFIALRKIKWGNRDEYKLDLRKYISTEHGEQMGKGLSFLTDDGPNELVKVLMENNYGKSDEIAGVICNNRKDIFDAISKNVNGIFPVPEDTENDEEMFDARSLFNE